MIAILFLPLGVDHHRWLPPMLRLADAEGWQVRELVHTWPDLVRPLLAGVADVGVVGTRAHMPQFRRPRLVVVDEHPRGRH